MTKDVANRPDSVKKGETQFRRALILWWIGSAVFVGVLFLSPGYSISGKILIALGLCATAVFLGKANDAARHLAGIVGLLGMLGSVPAACAVLEPETQIQGLLAIPGFVVCGLIWHAFLYSDDVVAYLKWRRASHSDVSIKDPNAEL